MFKDNQKLSVDYFANGNLGDVVTPIQVGKFKQLLVEANYPEEKRNFRIEGFTSGFDIGYQGPKFRQSTSDNIPFRIGNMVELWNKVMKEVGLGRYAGPFKEVPYPNYIQSPIGLVPKDGGKKTRLIFHLSYDFNHKNGESLNHYTPVKSVQSNTRT